MPLGREYGEIVADDVRENPDYARALLGEALTLLLDGDTSTAKIMFRDLVNGTLGFVSLARETGLNDKSIHRMLGANGNPRMENLILVAQALKKALGVDTRVETRQATGKKQPGIVSSRVPGTARTRVQARACIPVSSGALRVAARKKTGSAGVAKKPVKAK